MLGAFGEEVLSGFKNRFARYFGTDHMLLEGWRSYLTHLKPKPDDDTVQICFCFGAAAVFKTNLEIFRDDDTELALKRLKDADGADKLWEGYRACLANEIDAEILDQYKKAFYGGGWFINATFMALANEQNEEYFVRGMQALRDEINEFRTDIKQWTVAWKTGDTIKESRKTEFVLKLGDALCRIKEQPKQDTLEFMLTASTFMISLEYEQISIISCVQCAKHTLEHTRGGSLNPRKDLDWPYCCPGGDEFHFRCTSCGHSFPVTFWFTK